MTPFSILVKPVGGDCNLRCSYCFYRGHPSGRMDVRLFARMVESYEALPFAGKSVILQGGEPLLADPEIIATLNADKAGKSIQTNATLITDEQAQFFAANGWLVGASIDGSREMNACRGDSFDAAVRGIRRLEAAGADYNLMTVVSRANVAHPVETYRYLRDTFSSRFHQYIECTGPADAITGREWGAFLIGLFDEWIKSDSRTVSIRLFDSIVSKMIFGHPELCSHSAVCGQHLVVEYDGSVYPCDFYVGPETKLGNVAIDSWEAILGSPACREFAARKSAALPQKCRTCRHFEFCRGDCPRNRQSLCDGWIAFFDHALPRLRELGVEALRG